MLDILAAGGGAGTGGQGRDSARDGGEVVAVSGDGDCVGVVVWVIGAGDLCGGATITPTTHNLGRHTCKLVTRAKPSSWVARFFNLCERMTETISESLVINPNSLRMPLLLWSSL